jgi:hypothetical protein
MIKAGKPWLHVSFKGIRFIGTTTNEQYLWGKNAQGRNGYRFHCVVLV